jgi:LysR family glycine cleavage system transcriptional activator
MAELDDDSTGSALRLPPLVMLRAFEAAGRTGSMRRAAEDIGVSHTVISRHVGNLEHWVGRKLVKTGPRGVELTAEGEMLLAAVSEGFGIIARTTSQLRPLRRKGQLRIWCISGLATRWLTPRLSELEAALGDGIDIELRATDAKPDLIRREAEILIGFNILERLPEGAQHLIRPRMFPAVSPKWLRQHSAPKCVSDLAALPLIHEMNHVQWTNWFDRLGHKLTTSLTGPRLSDASISFDAALAGQGVALVNELLAAEQLQAGELVELLDTNVELGTYYLLRAPNRSANPLIRAFSDWIVAEMDRSLRIPPPPAANPGGRPAQKSCNSGTWC